MTKPLNKKRRRAAAGFLLPFVAAAALTMAPGASAQLDRPGGFGPRDTQQQNQPAGQRGLQPPTPQRPDNPPRWLYYGVMLILGGAAIFVGIMPSKRSHQD